MIELKFECRKCKLSLLEEPVFVAEGCADYVRATFELCPDWQKMTSIIANFKYRKDRRVLSVPVVGGACIVPVEVIKFPDFQLSLFGSNGSTHLTSAILEISVLRSDLGEGSPPEPTQTVFDVIMGELQTALAKVEELERRANTGDFDGADFHYWKIYLSVADMVAEEATIPEGAFVAINTGDAENEENSQVYYKGPDGLIFTADNSGQAGRAATIDIKATITGEPGSNATVENVGTNKDARFVFTIPQGPKGHQGNVGPQGIKGATGATGPKGDVGPIGLTGPTGPQGPQGVKGLIGPQGPVGPAGESGLYTPISGFFGVSVDSLGDLYVTCADGSENIPIWLDADFNLIYEIPEG